MPMETHDAWRHGARASRPRRGAEHNASFVGQLRRLEAILGEAEAHAAAHRFAQARAVLQPHVAEVPDPLLGHFNMLLGRCAMHGSGRDWQGPLHRARTAFQAAHDAASVATVRLYMGEAWAAKGELGQAQTHLRAALQGFDGKGLGSKRASALRLQAETYLWQQDVQPAQQAIDAAVTCSWADADNAQEALARLIRARVAATMGQMQLAAREMLWAERLVRPDTSPAQHIRVGLARAESLLWMDCVHRATAALQGMDGIALHHDAGAEAHYRRLLGRAQVVDAPALGHHNLSQAAATFDATGQSYYAAQCHLGLVRCEHRLQMPTRPRLQRLGSMAFGQWPILAAELQAVRQQVGQAPGRLTGPTAGFKAATPHEDPQEDATAAQGTPHAPAKQATPRYAQVARSLAQRLRSLWGRHRRGPVGVSDLQAMAAQTPVAHHAQRRQVPIASDGPTRTEMPAQATSSEPTRSARQSAPARRATRAAEITSA